MKNLLIKPKITYRKVLLLFYVMGIIVFLYGCRQNISDPEVPVDPKFQLDKYNISDNPFDNLEYCFEKARALLGDNAVLVYIYGRQKDTTPSSKYDLAWEWRFEGDLESLTFDVEKRIIIYKQETVLTMSVGYQVIHSPSEIRDLGLKGVREVWNTCLVGMPQILSVEMYIPLVPPPNDFYHYTFVGERIYVFNAKTGENVPLHKDLHEMHR